MHYEVFPIKATEPREVANRIAAAHEEINLNDGEVVASYALTCESQSDHQDDLAKYDSDYLFIVAAFKKQVAIGKSGGKASSKRAASD